uniref:Uncharacterized protein n=1 Tax=Anguilla anguilla TaxID=7936 RepID=A0A0E9QGF6_ANGAN
MYYPCSSYGSF